MICTGSEMTSLNSIPCGKLYHFELNRVVSVSSCSPSKSPWNTSVSLENFRLSLKYTRFWVTFIEKQVENDVFWQIFALKPPFSAICEEIYLKIIFFVVFDEKCSETCVIQEVPWFSKETLGEDEFLVRLSPNLSSPHHKCAQNDSPRLKVLCKVELPDAEIDEIQAGDHKIPNLNSPPLKCGQNHSPRLKVLCKLEYAPKILKISEKSLIWG